jgi:hypothetical protein
MSSREHEDLMLRLSAVISVLNNIDENIEKLVEIQTPKVPGTRAPATSKKRSGK